MLTSGNTVIRHGHYLVTNLRCRTLATRTPLTAVVMVSNRLWTHPAWGSHLATFTAAGARFVSPLTGLVGEPEPVQSGTGPDVVAGFDPAALARAVGAPAAS
jgi:hypothetical protein